MDAGLNPSQLDHLAYHYIQDVVLRQALSWAGQPVMLSASRFNSLPDDVWPRDMGVAVADSLGYLILGSLLIIWILYIGVPQFRKLPNVKS